MQRQHEAGKKSKNTAAAISHHRLCKDACARARNQRRIQQERETITRLV